MVIHNPMIEPASQVMLDRARNRLERSGDVDTKLLSEPVARSWARCMNAQLDPLAKPENLVLTSAQLRHLLDQHSVLRALAQPELELLYQQMAGSNYLLALGTPDGIVTDVLADAACADTKAGKAVIEGSIWSEALRGTNGMGLTVHDRAPRSVWRGEHFFRNEGAVSCIAVPIFDSFGAMAGLLDASTGRDDWHAHTMALLKMSAANIEAGLFHYQQDTRSILRVHPRPEYLPTMSAGLVAVDNDGRIVAVSQRGREILRIPASAPNTELSCIFADDPLHLMAKLPKRGMLRCALLGGGEVFVSSSHLNIRPIHRAAVMPQVVATPADPRRENLGFVANDLRLRAQLDAMERVVTCKAPIHIVGETGTGKELLARYIHALTRRRGRFVTVNCAALNDETGINDLFGLHDQEQPGQKPGLIGLADRGSIYFDDIEALPQRTLAALLRFIDTDEIRPTGGIESYLVDAQIISARLATPQTDGPSNLASIRQFHLTGFQIILPPLRDRSDFEDLAHAIIDDLDMSAKLSKTAMTALRVYDWPGNLRELRSALRIAGTLCHGDQIKAQDILRALPGLTAADVAITHTPGLSACPNCRDRSLQRQRCILIRETYLDQDRNAARTAQELGIARSTLYQHIGDLLTAK